MPVTDYFTMDGMLVGEKTDNGPNILGSIVKCIDENGNTTYTAAYKPYGDTMASTGSAPRFTWVGALGYNSAAGTAYAEQAVGARILSTESGAWTSTDPLWPREAAYCYVASRVTLRVDPGGLRSCTPMPSCADILKENPLPKDTAENFGFTDCCLDGVGVHTWICVHDSCQVDCTQKHEEVHQKQIIDCCKRAVKCYGKAVSSGSSTTDCENAYDTWYGRHGYIFECDAYTVSANCFKGLVDAKCKNLGTTTVGSTSGPDPCCPSWASAYTLDKSMADFYCLNAIPWKKKNQFDMNCPFNADGSIRKNYK